MRFALVNNARCEAAPKLSGRCPLCSADVTAKCGTKRIWHWSHRGKRNCDSWWETETEWHRAWKSLFPLECQEIHHVDERGERHIADIKTLAGLVIEVQHSAIAPAEMDAREEYYKQMVWVVDATRLKKDVLRFQNGARHFSHIGNGYFITKLPQECFPSAWLHRKVPVLFDLEALKGFQDGKPTENSRLWCLLPDRANGHAVAALVSRRQFAEIAQQRVELVASNQIMKTIREAMLSPRSLTPPPSVLPPYRPWRRRYARF
jgi:hypothetical protein